jgi:hypothetical protein
VGVDAVVEGAPDRQSCVSAAALLDHLSANVGAVRLELLHPKNVLARLLAEAGSFGHDRVETLASMRLDTRTSHGSVPCAPLLCLLAIVASRTKSVALRMEGSSVSVSSATT